MKRNSLLALWALTLVEELVAPGMLLQSPSSSTARLALLALAVLALFAILFFGFRFLLPKSQADRLCAGLERWFTAGGHLRGVLAVLLVLFIAALEFFLFTFMFLPAYLRGVFLWAGLAALQFWIALRVTYRETLRAQGPLFPRLKNLDRAQKRVLIILSVLGLLYFAAFIPVNLTGAETEHELLVRGLDEPVIYPILTNILTPGEDFRQTLYHIIQYEDYHYGYPFYVISALVLLPSRILFGADFAAHTQVNLLLLRQLVSVLPLILSAFILSYLATRWRSLWKSAIIFSLILLLPGVVHYNQQFWHPDGLTVLFVSLTLFFLDRDQLRFGRNFYLAALFTGLATATRLFGAFFFLAIGGVLLAGLITKKLTFPRAALAGLLFILVMGSAVLFSNPFLFDSGARGRMLATMQEKSGEMRSGYDEPDPENIYRTGWEVWIPFFEKSYGAGWFLAFLAVSCAAATVASRERIFPATLLAWCAVVACYLVYFVAVKSYQYMLPLFVPLTGAALMLPTIIEQRIQNIWARRIAWALTLALCAVQAGMFIAQLPLFPA